ncbi:MAG: PilT/PilU family type 4a pilus ATPase [Sulfuricurvum sp.]
MSQKQQSASVDINSLTFEQLKRIRSYLGKLIEAGGSDLHIKANSTIRARINGRIVPFSGSILSYEEAMTFVKEILRGRFGELVEKKDVDLVYQYDERNRFRVNIFFQTNGPSAVFRYIPMEIPTFDSMNYPEVMRKFTKEERGLVLVTGVTGSGKSTTLAAMINEINNRDQKHIITIEDPIEFVHKDRNCIINQRSIGQDALTFQKALRASLREDPDIILVGEMRDRETVELALHAADTGHLVFSTLHTIDARETVNRIVAMFPSDEQNRIRVSLATVLKGIVSQRLIPTVDNKRVAAFEILVKTPTIEKLILENRDYEIRDVIEKGREYYKSQSFDQHILELYDAGVITKDKAKEFATSPSDLELKMSGLNLNSSSTLGKKEAKTISKDEVFDLKE